VFTLCRIFTTSKSRQPWYLACIGIQTGRAPSAIRTFTLNSLAVPQVCLKNTCGPGDSRLNMLLSGQ